jgi:hypothetical protein
MIANPIGIAELVDRGLEFATLVVTNMSTLDPDGIQRLVQILFTRNEDCAATKPTLSPEADCKAIVSHMRPKGLVAQVARIRRCYKADTRGNDCQRTTSLADLAAVQDPVTASDKRAPRCAVDDKKDGGRQIGAEVLDVLMGKSVNAVDLTDIVMLGWCKNGRVSTIISPKQVQTVLREQTLYFRLNLP